MGDSASTFIPAAIAALRKAVAGFLTTIRLPRATEDGVVDSIAARQLEVTTGAMMPLVPVGSVIAIGIAVLLWPGARHGLLVLGTAMLLGGSIGAWRMIERDVAPGRAPHVARLHVLFAGVFGLGWCCVTIALAGHNSWTAEMLQVLTRMALIAVAMMMYLNLPMAFIAMGFPLAVLLVAGISDPTVFYFALMTVPVFLVFCLRAIAQQMHSFWAAATIADQLVETEAQRREGERAVERLRIEEAERALTATRSADAARRKDMLALAEQFEHEVVEVVDGVLNAVRKLEGSAATLTTVTSGAAAATNDVAGQAAATSASVALLAEATEGMALAITEIAGRIDEHARLSDHARGVAEASAARVDDLSQDAARISEIVTLITGVTARTRLLALNATIEAARAGEAGRGFAIVAGEVKSLAQRAGQATQSVTAEVGGIVERIGSATADIHRTATGIDGVARIASTIADTIVGQRAATELIGRETKVVVQRIDEMHRRVAALADGAGTTGRMTGEVAATASHLDQQARTLDEATKAFLHKLRAA